MKSSKVFLCSALLVFVAQSARSGDAAKPDSFTVVSQKTISGTACTGCSLYHLLANGRPELQKIAHALPGDSPENRVRHLIDKYGAGPSTVYPNRARYSAKTGGLAAEDMSGFVNDCLKEFGQKPLAAAYLDRKKDETREQHLRRIHALLLNSVKAGVPPIVNVRSYATVKNKDNDDYSWNGLYGHSITILDVEPLLRENDKGFRFWYAESDTGHEKASVESAYASLPARNYTAPRAFSVLPDKTEKWEWVPNAPFLIVTAPAMPLGTDKEPGHKRTVITLRHAVYADK